MPNDRDRARAKRRLAKREASATARAAHRRRNQAVIGTVVTVLVVVAGVFALSRLVGSPTTPPTPAAASATGPANPCPVPDSTPVPTAPAFPAAPAATLAKAKTWDATLTTTCGAITVELYGDKAPQTVASFIFLSRKGFYTGSPCHRLTSSESLKVLQCGDPTGTGTGGPGYGFGVENVPADGSYPTGTLAMARGSDVNSNGSQFFIVYGDSRLPVDGGGYTVFGKVTSGLDVLTTVAAGGTTSGESDGAPARAVSVESVTVAPR